MGLTPFILFLKTKTCSVKTLRFRNVTAALVALQATGIVKVLPSDNVELSYPK